MFPYIGLYLTIVLLSGAIIWSYRRRTRPYPYPAGPPGYPVIGNLFDWPFESGWLKFTDWSMSYGTDSLSFGVLLQLFSWVGLGDIVHLQIFGVHIAILNSVDVTQALFTQAAYSDRPRLVMAGEL